MGFECFRTSKVIKLLALLLVNIAPILGYVDHNVVVVHVHLHFIGLQALPVEEVVTIFSTPCGSSLVRSLE